MKKLLVSFVAVLFAAPLVVSAQTTRLSDRPASADRPASDTKAPAWKNTAALHETKDIIGTRIKSTDGKDLGEVARAGLGVLGEFLHDPQTHGVSKRSQGDDRLLVDGVAHVASLALHRLFPI